MKVANIVGARPNLVKIAPLMEEMHKHPEIQARLVHTGQHYDERLSDTFFRQLGIPEPDANLEVGSGPHGWQTAEILKGLESFFLDEKPDLVLVVGDVNSTTAAALAAAKLNIPVAHVEAGLRSFDRTMPEEVNRIVTDALAAYLFVTERSAITNLLREGHPPQQIHFVGNVMIDALRRFLPVARQSRIGEQLSLTNDGTVQQFAVLTLHRPSNVDSVETLSQLLKTIEAVADQIPVIFPVHPRTERKLAGLALHHPHLHFIHPVGYIDFLWLLSQSRLALTDSGGIQEETTALGIPCLTLRENTERPITVTDGTNQIVGTDSGRTTEAVGNILAGRKKAGRLPELWDGRAAERIVKILLRDLPLADGTHAHATAS